LFFVQELDSGFDKTVKFYKEAWQFQNVWAIVRRLEDARHVVQLDEMIQAGSRPPAVVMQKETIALDSWIAKGRHHSDEKISILAQV